MGTMNDPHPAAPRSEDDYHTQAERAGASKEHADRVLHQAVLDSDREQDGSPYELAYLQLVADLNQNPK